MAAENLHEFDQASQAAGNEEPEGGTMTLIEHLEELRGRMIKGVIAVAVCSILGFVFWDRILTFLLIPLPAAANKLPNAVAGQLVARDIGEPFMVALKLAIAIGIMVASPVLLYQTWAFIAPALTRRERQIRFFAGALLVLILGAMTYNEYAVWSAGASLRRDLETEHLTDMNQAWDRFQAIANRNYLPLVLRGTKSSVLDRMVSFADRVITRRTNELI